jgi:hypothetical protein
MTDIDTRVVLEDEYLDAAQTLRRNAGLRKQLDYEDARAREILAKVLATGETGTDINGDLLVKVQPGARVFNEQAARDHLPPDLLASITITVTEERLDRQKAKDTLAPALYALACKQNADTIKVL